MGDTNAVDDPRFTPLVSFSSMRFATYTAEEIRSISCKCVTNPDTFDHLLHPNNGGLYDPALGPSDKQELCGTCGLNYVHCPGHLGHISLPVPVFHPIFFPALYQILRTSCFNCHRFLSTAHKGRVLKGQMRLLDKGLASDALELNASVLYDEEEGKGEKTHADRVLEYVRSCLKRNQQASSTGSPTAVQQKSKHLTDLQRQLVSDFLKSMSSVIKCPHCSAPVRKVRQEHQSKVFLRGLSPKQATNWVISQRKEQAQEATQLFEQLDVQEIDTVDSCQQLTVITPQYAQNHLRAMWSNDPLLLAALFSSLRIVDDSRSSPSCAFPTDLFFLDVIAVPPSRFRPISQMGSKRFENSQTTNLQQVLVDCMAIQELVAENDNPPSVKVEADEPSLQKPNQSFLERWQRTWLRLQSSVNTFMDSDIERRALRDSSNGIRQILEKKEGLFRKHMMGKRVNYAARSVISPDPYIDVDEIGVPMVFATKLTYPQPVTHWNVHELRRAVVNGPNIYPGATHVQNEDGSLVMLHPSQPHQRKAVAKKLLTPSKAGTHFGSTKKVYRHLKNGDALLMNRQPTLHKPSIMAHKARVLPGEKTLRLHYANCKSFNADFDGDEMNAHFPQNELARSEAYNIVSTRHQYLVPKDGTPLSGLIQDHIVSGVIMTIRGRFFEWSDYQMLMCSALSSRSCYIKTLPPCVLKPQQLWSGKQVISTLLLNLIPKDQNKLNLISKSKINPKEWGRHCKPLEQNSEYTDDVMSESEVVFRDGELMCGVLDKSQYGASQYGFVHTCYELYGGETSCMLLSALGRLFTKFLQLCGFTLGVEDILVTKKADKERRKSIRIGRNCGPEAAVEAFNLDDFPDEDAIKNKFEDVHHRRGDDTGLKVFEYCVKKRTDKCNNAINMSCVPAGLCKPFPWNCLQLMVQAGAKGSTVNTMQISCLLGQIELEGRRPPLMLSGKFLPSFLPYDTSPRAGGFVDGRFLTGIRPQEYFYHCMAGREGLVDTAVKTSRSGYLQRCLIKHLEGICVQYDLTVRDSDGSLIQFLYGEDGRDIGKTQFLYPKQFDFLSSNYKALLYQLKPQAALDNLNNYKASKFQSKIDRWKRKRKSQLEQNVSRKSGFLKFYEMHLPEAQEQARITNRDLPNKRTEAQQKVIDMWYSQSPMFRDSMRKKCYQCPAPVMSRLRPDYHFGAVPEKLLEDIDTYLINNPDWDSNVFSGLNEDKFRSLIQLKSLRALCEPGESVGLLAAQSIGEPSTQMTLNTFHFAGRGEMNVTLGIPRLREILMTASANIKTPAMDVPLLCRPDAKQQGEHLKRYFTRVCLADVMEKVEVWESVQVQRGGGEGGEDNRNREYRIRMTFLPHDLYSDDYVVTPSQVLTYVEEEFIKRLASQVNKEIRKIREKSSKSVGIVSDKEATQSSGVDESNANEENDVMHDDDEETDLSDMDEENADATSSKQMKKKRQHVSYEDESETELEDKAEYYDGLSSDEEAKPVPRIKKSNSDNEAELDTSSIIFAEDSKRRQKSVKCSCSHVVDYRTDPDDLWCEVTLRFGSVDCKLMMTTVIEKMAKKMVVWEVPRIKRGLLVASTEPGEDGVWRLKTEGVNIQELWKYDHILDLRRAYSNNIHSIASTYGIEAASRAIIKEISGVFRVYGITVDYRHLSLIADYMTYDGQYKPFNRIGMETNSSPFQKMSFETTIHFLRSAAIAGDSDSLVSPSACLVTGRVVKGGTGSFDLLQKLQ